MQKARWIDIIHVVGSVASITGISLLWLKATFNVHTLVITIPTVSLLALFSLGVASLGIIAIRYGYGLFPTALDTFEKIAYFGITVPVVFAFIGWFLLIIWGLGLQEVRIMMG